MQLVGTADNLTAWKDSNIVRWRVGIRTDRKGERRFDSFPDYKLKIKGVAENLIE